MQERYGNPPQRTQPIDIPALAGTTATAARHIDAPAGTATVTVKIIGQGDPQQLIFHADTYAWTGDALGQPLSTEAVHKELRALPAHAQEQLEGAGSHALRIARARQAGIAKRKANMKARQSPVGRSPLRS